MQGPLCYDRTFVGLIYHTLCGALIAHSNPYTYLGNINREHVGVEGT